MSTWVTDCGKRYIVKEENAHEAAEWLNAEWYGGYGDVCRLEKDIIDGDMDEVFDGNVGWSYFEYATKFIDMFCEPGSYASFRDDDYFEYSIVWKDEDGTHDDCEPIENPFFEKMEELDGRFK